MSLLQKASIITTPTAYAEDYLYSIKPAIPFGDELVTNGNFTSDLSNWQTSSWWTWSALGAYHAPTTDHKPLYQETCVVGKKYLITFDLNVIQGAAKFSIGLNTGSTTQVIATALLSGSYRYEVTAAATHIIFNRNFTGTNNEYYVKNVSVKEMIDADFDFDRNSTGTRVNEDYLIEDVPYNFVTYSEDYSNSGWTKENITILSNNIISPDGTLNGDKISETATNTYHALSQSINISLGNYTISVFAKLDERQYILIRSNLSGSNVNTTFDLSNGLVTYNGHTSASIESAGNGWYRCSVTSNSSVTSVNTAFLPSGIDITNNNLPTYLGVVGSGLYIYGAQIVKGDQPKDYLKTTDRLDIPRIDYTNGEPSIKLEPQRINELFYSNDFSQSSWQKLSGSSVSTNRVLSPEGINNAWQIIFDGTSNARIEQARTGMTNGADYTVSVYARVASGTQQIEFGSVTTASYILTTQWQRITRTEAENDTTSYSRIVCASANTIELYGFQLEAGSYATSLIHTSGSAVTRSADKANNAGNSDLFNSEEGVVYLESKSTIETISGYNYYIAVSDGTSSNRLEIRQTGANLQFLWRVGGAYQNQIISSGIQLTNFNKIALKYSSSEISYWINENEIGTISTPTLFPANTLTELAFDDGGGGNPFQGNCKMVAVFKEALTDTELEKLTGYNNHELYMNYYNRLSYLGLVEEYNVESDINNYIL